jgi:hypothetical protein
MVVGCSLLEITPDTLEGLDTTEVDMDDKAEAEAAEYTEEEDRMFMDAESPDEEDNGIIDSGVLDVGMELATPVLNLPAPVQEESYMVRGYFARTVRDCNVRMMPNSGAAILNMLVSGRRLWVEVSEHPDWRSVYTKRQLAYMHRICFGE